MHATLQRLAFPPGLTTNTASLSASENVTKDVADYLLEKYLSGKSGPLGNVYLDGIDIADVSDSEHLKWDELVKLINASTTDRRIYISASPECVYPDYYLDSAIQTGLVDYVWVEFYYQNPSCIYSNGDASKLLSAWETWTSRVPNSLIFLGLAANDTIAGYIEPDALKSEVDSIKKIVINHGCHETTINIPPLSPCNASFNTDGIHIGRSIDVKVLNTNIGTGDDCISLGDGSKQITVQNVNCGPGHGISVGSLGKYPNEEPVEGLLVKNCTLTDTDNGVRIKTWPNAPGTSPVTDMHFEDITVVNVKNPVIIDQEYCPWNQCNKQTPSKVKISRVSFKNIKGTSGTPEGVVLICSSGNPCEGVELSNVDLTFNGAPATAKCANVKPVITGKAPTCAA
ncbi:polygalacturonase-like [Gastrolobium bilobum]|uniref:polygalacturonase-like n=1 Tax=Gastrolobium bilobum TaxID=150636 RepID=UPI002AB177F2|nr:polygalacturonase-like [Gastrolobium bilobum]